MKYRLFFLNICLLFLHISCEEELQIPIPNEKSKLVVNALIGVDSLLQIHVSKSSVFANEASNTPLSNAIVKLKKNDQLVGNMMHKNDGWYSLASNILLANNSYQIEVSHPDLETVNSETEVLEKVAIAKLTYQQTENNKLEFTLQFQDIPLQNNYYMLLLKAVNGTESSTLTYYSDDIIFNGNLSENTIGINQNMLRGSRTFSDENLDGDNNSITIYVYNELIDITDVSQEYKLELYNITPDYFKYERSITSYNNRDDLPFYNKVNLHSNVIGGYGIFTSYAVDSRSIIIN